MTATIGLLPGHLRRHARELARVPEALEVEQDDLRARVLGPVGEQVVARHVGLVADRYEAREAQPAARVRSSSTAMPRAPLCDSIAMLPAGGAVGAKVAFKQSAGSVFRTPMQLGPTILIPEARTRSRSRRSAARPAAEASPNPDEITTTPWTPARAQSVTTSCTAAAGTAMTARSTG